MIAILNAIAIELAVFAVTQIATMIIDDVSAAKQQKAQDEFIKAIESETATLNKTANDTISELNAAIGAGVQNVNDAIASADAALKEPAKLVDEFNKSQNSYYDYAAFPFGGYQTNANSQQK